MRGSDPHTPFINKIIPQKGNAMLDFIKNINGELVLTLIVIIQAIQHHRLEKRVKELEDNKGVFIP